MDRRRAFAQKFRFVMQPLSFLRVLRVSVVI
jgi:hypothetical protein